MKTTLDIQDDLLADFEIHIQEAEPFFSLIEAN